MQRPAPLPQSAPIVVHWAPLTEQVFCAAVGAVVTEMLQFHVVKDAVGSHSS
jgi:hypothetical protein